MRRCVLAGWVATLLVACGAASPPARSPGAGGASGPAPSQPQAPPPPSSPRPLTVQPTECQLGEDLPAPALGDGGACGASDVTLGSSFEGVLPHGTADMCSHHLGCDFGCGQVAVSGGGAVSWWQTLYLGGGGYVEPVIETFTAGGAPVSRTGNGPLAPGPDGFLAYGLTPWPERLPDALPGAGVNVPWPVRFLAFGPGFYAGPIAFHADATGGVTIAVAGVAPDDAAEVWVARVDASGAVATAPFRVLSLPASLGDWARVDRGERLAEALGQLSVGRDAGGRFLILWSGRAACAGGATAGRWFAPDGTALTGAFKAMDGSPPGELVLLPDGSLGFHSGLRWPRRFADGIASGGPAPAWLDAADGIVVRGVGATGRFVALHSACERLDRRARVDVVAAGGRVCASALAPAPELAADPCADAGSRVAAATPAVGYDGSLAQLAAQGCDRATGCVDYECRFTVWPQAVK